MAPFTAFVKAVTAVNEWIGRCAAFLILPIFALLLLEVGLRYLLASPTVWTNELAQMFFGSYALLSGGYLLARGGHANVDIVHSILPPRIRAAVDIFTSVLIFIFIGALIWFGGEMALRSLGRMETSMSAWNPPIWPVKALIPIAAILVLLQALAKLIRDIQIASGKAPPEAEPEPAGRRNEEREA